VTVIVSIAKGGETIEESSIASKQTTVGVSTAKGGETAEHSMTLICAWDKCSSEHL